MFSTLPLADSFGLPLYSISPLPETLALRVALAVHSIVPEPVTFADTLSTMRSAASIHPEFTTL